MRTPDAVKEAAKDRASCYSRVGYAHLGPYQGYEVYTLRVFDELPLPIGLPEIYLFKEGLDVITVCGHDVFEIMDEATKAMLDDMHKRKIDMADEIYVINVGGYIGESTRSEIAYAEKNGKVVRYLE